jgi:hypothetical protein
MAVHLSNLTTFRTYGNPMSNYIVLYTSVLSVQYLFS